MVSYHLLNLNMKFFAFILLLCTAHIVSAQTTSQSKTDTMGLKLVHVVKKGETFYGIAKEYDMSVMDLKSMNPGLDVLQPGLKLNVIKNKIIATGGGENSNPNTLNTVDHVVAKDETLYSLSKKYNTTVAIIRELNGLGDEGLKLGQTIKLPSINPVSIQTKPIEHSTKVIDPSKPSIPKSTDGKVTTEPEVNEKTQDKSPEKTQEKSPEKPETNPSKEGGIIESSSKGSKVKYVEKESKGTLKIVEATSIPAEDAQRAWVWFEDGKKNDVVAIINPQNNQIVYAMVQGEGKSKKSVTVTPFVAQKLGIFDEKTVVRVRYAVPNK